MIAREFGLVYHEPKENGALMQTAVQFGAVLIGAAPQAGRPSPSPRVANHEGVSPLTLPDQRSGAGPQFGGCAPVILSGAAWRPIICR